MQALQSGHTASTLRITLTATTVQYAHPSQLVAIQQRRPEFTDHGSIDKVYDFGFHGVGLLGQGICFLRTRSRGSGSSGTGVQRSGVLFSVMQFSRHHHLQPQSFRVRHNSQLVAVLRISWWLVCTLFAALNIESILSPNLPPTDIPETSADSHDCHKFQL